MARNIFPEYEYVTLDNGRERVLASDDPELFLDAHSVPLIIDEIQKVPSLMEAIKIRIDETKLKNTNTGTSNRVMYILTGSNSHEIREKASETLAGRTAIIEVNSFSQPEKRKIVGHEFVPEIEILKKRQKNLGIRRNQRIYRLYKKWA